MSMSGSVPSAETLSRLRGGGGRRGDRLQLSNRVSAPVWNTDMKFANFQHHRTLLVDALRNILFYFKLLFI